MFAKIVSNLSFSPQVAGQLTFYLRRLRKEELTRRLSALAAAIVLVEQLFFSMAPAVSVNASGPNDIIHGGFSSKSELAQLLVSNDELKHLFAYFHIGANEVNKASGVKLIPAKNSNLYSLGRHRKAASDHEIHVNGRTYYLRPLRSVATTENARVIEGTTEDGKYFAVLLSCGNIAVPAIPSPEPTPPPPEPVTPTPPPEAPITPSPPPIPPDYRCDKLTVTPINTTTYEFAVAASVTNTQVTGYIYNFGDGKTIETDQFSSKLQHSYDQPGTYTVTVQVKTGAGTTSVTAPCTYTISIAPPPTPDKPEVPQPPPPPGTPRIERSKAAVYPDKLDNNGKPISAANTTANAGDVIAYTLTTKNTGSAAVTNLAITEQLADVLEYADLIDNGGGTLSGTVLTWPSVTIPAGGQVVKTFKVKVKSPVPVTPRSASDISSFDLVMNNVYQNAININVAPPPAKQVEVAAATLPETGSGTGLMLVLVIVAGVVYFYARSKQLATEVSILRGDFNGGPS